MPHQAPPEGRAHFVSGRGRLSRDEAGRCVTRQVAPPVQGAPTTSGPMRRRQATADFNARWIAEPSSSSVYCFWITSRTPTDRAATRRSSDT